MRRSISLVIFFLKKQGRFTQDIKGGGIYDFNSYLKEFNITVCYIILD